MGDIYGDAQRVLACVGDHHDDSHFLFTLLRRHANPFLDPSLTNFTKEVRRLWFRWILSYRISTQQRASDALDAFTQRPYFQRLWVVQELFRGHGIILCCGADYIPDFETLYTFTLRRKIYPRARLVKKLSRLLYRHYGFASRFAFGFSHRPPYWMDFYYRVITADQAMGFSLIRIIQETSHLLCQAPRDKVYGLLAMVYWGMRNPIQPDYSKGRLGLFIEVLLALKAEDNPIRGFCPASSYSRPDLIYKVLELENSSLRKLNCTDAMIADVIELRQSPAAWPKPIYHKTEEGSGGRADRYITFRGCRWQFDEPPAGPMAVKPLEFRFCREVISQMILTDQGEACFVHTEAKMGPGVSIARLNGLQVEEDECDIGPTVLGLVMEKHADGQFRVTNLALIHEAEDCDLKYGMFCPGGPIGGTVITRTGCRDAVDQLISIYLRDVKDTPSYGIRRTGVEFFKHLQELGSGDDAN